MNKKKIILITGGSYRHMYFRNVMTHCADFDVVKTFMEYPSDEKIMPYREVRSITDLHNVERERFERDYFEPFVQFARYNRDIEYIKRKDVNKKEIVDDIKEINPDLICVYGSAVIKKDLLKAFPNRIINAHLGLSPYYFGSATNLFAMRDGNLSAVGYTLMFMDEGVDTGQIIHQRRCEPAVMDTCHSLGNRVIRHMVEDFTKLVSRFEQIEISPIKTDYVGETFKKKDITDEVLAKVYQAFGAGMCEDYLKNKDEYNKIVPIVEQKFLK